MERRTGSLLFVPFLLSGILAGGQTDNSAQPQPSAPASSSQTSAPAIPADAPRMSRQTRLELIRDFEAQILYARVAFPMGAKGLRLKDGVTSPNGAELQQVLALWGPAIKPGDPAHISFVQRSEERR